MLRLAGLSALAVLLLAITANAQEGPKQHPYFPLKKDSVWVYKVQGGPITVKVTGTEKAGSATGYKLETSAGNKVSATEVVAVTSEGVQRFSVNGLNADPPITFLPADPDATKTWKVDSKVSGQDIRGDFNINKESVEVPAGKYEAIHVKGADMTIGSAKTTVEYWFAKDVGIVKLKFTLGTTQDATLELESYTPGK